VETVTSIVEMKRAAGSLRRGGRTVALVPTMGALHEGHLSLIRQADARANVVVVSIFVNPTQFGPSEDFDTYPRDLERDSELAQAAGCDIIFAPEVDDMYPASSATRVCVSGLTERLCGAFRPGHFDGVCTVVAKLFSIVRPHLAVFGQKDGQQVAVIERMVADLEMGVEIVRSPIVREPDGLAMSSRNAYLSGGERRDAVVLFESLKHAVSRYGAGERNVERIVSEMREMIEAKETTDIQYIAAVDARTLEDVDDAGEGVMLALAVFVGKTRLIDNVILGAE
jgi:pantoate--beta-alanine ligase